MSLRQRQEVEALSSRTQNPGRTSWRGRSEDLLAQRIYGLACGHPDANDADRLADDPIHKLLLGRDPVDGDALASQPTISRFENGVGPRELLTTALVRARFCELIGPSFGERKTDQLFTMGLFSVLDALMDMPMTRALRPLPLTEEMRLIRAQVRRRQSVRGAVEEPGKLLDVLDVVRDRGRGIVATVEFLQHRLSEMGHKKRPMTPTLPGRSAQAHA